MDFSYRSSLASKQKTKFSKKRPIVFTFLNGSIEDLFLVKRVHLFKARHEYVQNDLQLVV